MTRLILTCSALILAPAQTSDASAEVSSRSETGFILSLKRRATASVEEVFSATGRPAASWSDAHTSSGDAGNLHLDL